MVPSRGLLTSLALLARWGRPAPVLSLAMDTLIFGGLLATWFVLYQQRGRTLLLAAWGVMFVAALLLLAHHITSSLSLGLSY